MSQQVPINKYVSFLQGMARMTGLLAPVLVAIISFGWKLSTQVERTETSVAAIKASLTEAQTDMDKRPTADEVDRRIDVRIASALQNMHIAESIATLNAKMDGVREDIKELKHAGK